MRIEGFWRLNREKNAPNDRYGKFPWPKSAGIGVSVEFLLDLKIVESAAKKTLYRGFSICRLCGKANGSAEYEYSGYTWPEGFRHYLVEHSVIPSADFMKMIREKARFKS